MTDDPTRALAERPTRGGLEAAARAWPARVAAETGTGEPLTYAELYAQAAGLAAALAARGLGRGARVAVCLPPGPATFAAIHGTWLSGAACVPLDADMPAARRAAILADSQVAGVVADERLRGQLGAAEVVVEVPAVGGLGAALAPVGPPALPPAPAADDLALLLYTSGSTGRPKGVLLSHANVTAALAWYAQASQPGPDDRFASHAPFQFSATIFNAFVPGLVGAAVVILDERVRRSPRELAAVLTARRVSIWMCAPSVLRLLLQHGGLDPAVHRFPRLLLCGGEVLPPASVRALRALFPGTTVRALYASTETNGCTLFEPPAEERPGGRPPMGRGVFGVQVRVADESGADVTGAPGDVWVSGPAVALGYGDARPEAGPAFVTDATGCRWFRSGDLGVRDASGELWYVGRRDRTVKRRGYRVALEEIEACVRRHPAVAEAAVVARPDPLSGVRLVGIYATHDGAPLAQVELRQFCAATLPAYMLPDTFTHRPGLPRTPNGKLDLQALQREAG